MLRVLWLIRWLAVVERCCSCSWQAVTGDICGAGGDVLLEHALKHHLWQNYAVAA
jgi:hypothetical protein